MKRALMYQWHSVWSHSQWVSLAEQQKELETGQMQAATSVVVNEVDMEVQKSAAWFKNKSQLE